MGGVNGGWKEDGSLEKDIRRRLSDHPGKEVQVQTNRTIKGFMSRVKAKCEEGTDHLLCSPSWVSINQYLGR